METKQTGSDLTTPLGSPIGPEASYIPLIVVTITLVLLVYSLVAYFANSKVHSWYVKVTTLVGWFFPFWIVFLLPLDLASTMYDHCEGECKVPFAHVSSDFLYIAWRTVYWTAFGLTWVIIPLMQSYVDSGEFTFGMRLTGAIKQNLKFYLIYAALGVVGVVYVITAKPFESRDALMGFVMAMANSWGLLLAILFMGYGLVSVPRQLWYVGDTTRQLNALYTRAPKAKEDFEDSETQVVQVAKEVSYVSRRLSSMDPLRPLVDKILEAFPLALDPQMNGREARITDAVPKTLTVAYLAALNRRMKRAVRMRDRNFAIWDNLLLDAFLLQDIAANAENTDRRFHSTVRELGENGVFRDLKLSLEWWWYINLRPIVTRFLAILFGILSVAVVWSELTFNAHDPVLSIVAIGLRAGGLNYAYAEIISFITVCYMCVCAYSSLLRLKVFSFYVLVPNHQTDELSLLWFAAYLCRLMAPLCHNYLNLASKQEDTNGTVFFKFMGKADLAPFLGSYFVDWFPVVILIPATLQLLNVQNRLLRLCGMGDYEVDDDDDAPATGQDAEALGRGRIALNTDVEEGMSLVNEERHAEERRLRPDQEYQRSHTLLGRAYASQYSRGRQLPRAGESGSSRRSALDVENSYVAADPNTARLRAELLNSRNGNRERGSRPASSPSSRSSSVIRAGLSREDRDRRIDELLASRKGKSIGTPTGGGGTGGGYLTEDEDDGDESNESSFLRLTSKAKKGFGDLFKINNSNNDSGASSAQDFSGAGASGGDSRERLLGRGRTAQREPSQLRSDMNNADADMDPIQSIVVPDEHRSADSGRARSISPNSFSSFARASGASSFGGAGGGGGFGGGNGGSGSGGGARVSPFARFEGPPASGGSGGSGF